MISVDTKKKELVGEFKNGGREWQPQGRARGGAWSTTSSTRLGQGHPLWRLRPQRERGLGECRHRSRHGPVRCGKRFADGGRRWARSGIPTLTALLITADGGGSNGSRCRLWKIALQELAVRLELPDSRVPFSTRDQQVEQDRAPHVLPHHPELARPSAGEPRGHRQSDREHGDTDRLENPCRT